MDLKYTGPFDVVEIAATGQTVTRGETATIDPEIAKALLTQTDTWKTVKTSDPKTSKKTTSDKGD